MIAASTDMRSATTSVWRMITGRDSPEGLPCSAATVAAAASAASSSSTTWSIMLSAAMTPRRTLAERPSLLLWCLIFAL